MFDGLKVSISNDMCIVIWQNTLTTFNIALMFHVLIKKYVRNTFSAEIFVWKTKDNEGGQRHFF